MEANIGQAVTKRETFLEAIVNGHSVSTKYIASNLTNVSADGVASSAIPTCGVKVPCLGGPAALQLSRRSFRC